MRDPSTGLFAAASLGLAVFCALPGYQSDVSARLDDALFRLGARLLPPAAQQAAEQLQLVTLPAELQRARQPSAAATTALVRLLDALHQHGGAAIGVSADLDALLWSAADVAAMATPAAERRAAAALIAPYRQLGDALAQQPVAWLSPPSRFSTPTVPVEREFRWPLLYSAHDRLLGHAFDGIGQPPPSLLELRDGHWQAGFELTVLAHQEGAPAVRWQVPETLRLGNRQLTASPYGAIRPWPQEQAIATLYERAMAPADVGPASRGRIVLLGV